MSGLQKPGTVHQPSDLTIPAITAGSAAHRFLTRPAPHLLALIGIVAIGLLLRLGLLAREALEGDEMFSRAVSVSPFASGIAEIQRDVVHPPLYYLLLRSVLTVGPDNPATLRVLSLLTGMLLVVLTVYWIQGIPRNWWCGLFAGLLLAVSPLQVLYSQQARSYALYAFLVLLAAVILHRALQQPERSGLWAGFSLVSAAAVLTHYVAALYLACMLPALLLSRTPRLALYRWAAAMIAPGVLLTGWLYTVWPHYRLKGGLDANLSWVGSPRFYEFTAVYAAFTGLPQIPRGTTLSLLIGIGIILLTAAALYRARKSGALPDRPSVSEWALLGCLAVLPPALLFLLTQPPISLPIWGIRHLLPSQALWVGVLALMLWTLFQRTRMVAVALGSAVVLLHALALPPVLQEPFRVPHHEVAAFIGARALPTHSVFTTAPYNVAQPVNYYLAGSGVVLPFEGAAGKPAEFWLLYRPHLPSEVAQLDALLDGGWTIRDLAHFGDAYGTTVVLLAQGSATLLPGAGIP